MAVSTPSISFGASFFPSGSHPTQLFPDDSGSIGLYTTFGEDDSNNTSFGSWPDTFSCSELEVSSFPSAESFTSLLNSPALPCEDDLNLGPEAVASEFLGHFGGHPNTSVVVHSECMDTPKADQLIPEELFVAEENQFAPNEGVDMDAFPAGAAQLSDDDDRSINDGRLEIPGDRFPGLNEEESAEEEPSDGVHIPPPLNMKRIEMHDDAYYESIEAAEVPLDVIENKRPFQCGLAGCDKTFKNPQTMKMHHKTHFSDGSAVVEDLSTLAASGTGNMYGSGNGWMTGRSKKIPSRCPKCRRTFVGLYELRRHYGRKHSEGERPFQCRKCDKRFYIEVDVRDHEKLCGEQIECKCGLKFAFKCNMVAHKKAHPACQDPHPSTSAAMPKATSANSTSTHSTSVSIILDPSVPVMNPHSTSVTIMDPSVPLMDPHSTSDEDSSRSRWISPGAPPQRDTGNKRCHELVEASRPDLMSKPTKVYSRRGLPAQNFSGPGPQADATSAGFDLAALGALWGSYPNLPWTVNGPVLPPSVFGGLFPRRGGAPGGKLGALDLLHLAGVTHEAEHFL